MKRTISLVLALLMLLALCGCGSSAKYGAAVAEGGYYVEPDVAAAYNGFDDYGTGYGYEDYDYYEEPTEASAAGTAAGSTNTAVSSAEFDTEKIIYTGYAEIETTDYEKSCADVAALIERTGGFLESSTTYGSDYWTDGHRTAEYVIRIPRACFAEVTSGLSDIGNVTYSSVSADNITANYRDTESRLAAYRTEEERLLAMLELAYNVTDMLDIEDRLADVRYNIESLTTTLQGWDSLVSYSTLTISLEEVIEFTPDPTEEKGYWAQIAEGFGDTLKGVGTFFAELFKGILIALPVLVLLAVVAVVVIVLIKRSKKRRAKKKAKAAAPEDKTAE